jgi:L-xylulokinase
MRVSAAGDLIGLDIGSTLVKAARFDRRGRLLAVSRRVVRIDRPAPGRVERDAEATWRAAAACLRGVARGARVAAVGITGCGNGAIFTDVAGALLLPGILSSDTRAAAWRPSSGRTATGAAYAGQTPGLIAWLKAEEPALARRAARVYSWKDYIRFRLTGESAADPTDVGAAGWAQAADEPWLAPVLPSLAVAGRVPAALAHATGLAADTPVVTGCIDCEAAAIGSGLGAAGDVSVVAGTWSINQLYRPLRATEADQVFLCNPCVRPGQWLWLEGSPTSAANFEWAMNTFLPGCPLTTAMARAARAPKEGPIFVPRVPLGTGAFFELGLPHGPADLVRAVMAGVAFSHRAHVERLQVIAGEGKVRLCGGAARSRFWSQLFADVLNRTVEIPAGEEVGALGAVLCAGVAVGWWPSLDVAQAEVVRVARRFEPKDNYDEAYVRYTRHAHLVH